MAFCDSYSDWLMEGVNLWCHPIACKLPLVQLIIVFFFFLSSVFLPFFPPRRKSSEGMMFGMDSWRDGGREKRRRQEAWRESAPEPL